MNNYFKGLRTIYQIEIALGIIAIIFVVPMVAIMGMDSPSATIVSAFLAGGMAFIMVLIPIIIIPLLAIKELDNYYHNKKILFNGISAFILLIGFLPIGLWMVYTIIKITQHRDEIKINPEVHNTKQTTMSSSNNTKKIIFFVLLFIVFFYTTSKYKSYLQQVDKIIVTCDSKFLVTKNISDKKIFFGRRAALQFKWALHNLHEIGHIEKNKVVITNQYIDNDKINEIEKCIEYSDLYDLEISIPNKL